MKQRRTRIPDLTDIAFEGRNQEYGAFVLRKKYRKYLLWSMLFANLLFLLFILVPWSLYYFSGDDSFSNPEDLYSVDYTFIPPPEDMPLIPDQPPASAASPEEITAPVVVDSVKDVKEVKSEIQDNPQDSKHDSTAVGPGSTGTEGQGSDNGAIYTVLDVYPRYPGGDQARLSFLRANIRYPKTAMNKIIQGVVKIIFVVESDGTLSKFDVTKGIGGGCDEEALRVAKLMPRWEPGRRNGKSVRVMISMPIVFRLPNKP